jgi:hypothetical protein
MSLDTSPVLRSKLHSTSHSKEQRSREEGEKGTKGYLPAKAADTLLSLKRRLLYIDGGLFSTIQN